MATQSFFAPRFLILVALVEEELPQLTKAKLVNRTSYRSVKALTMPLVHLEKGGFIELNDRARCPHCGEFLGETCKPKDVLVVLTNKGVQTAMRIKAMDDHWNDDNAS